MQAQSKSNPTKKTGHNRRPSFGKIMPISSILDNLMNPNLDQSTNNTQPITHNFRTIERSDADRRESITDMTADFIQHERCIEQNKEPLNIESIDLNKTFSKCVNYHHLDGENADSKNDTERKQMSDEPNVECSICNNEEKTLAANQTFDFQQPLSVLCKKLCDGSYNTSTKTCQSTDNMSQLSTEPDTIPLKSPNKNDAECPAKVISAETIANRNEFLNSMLAKDASVDSANDVSMETNTSDNNSCAPLTIENLKQFNEKFLLGKLAIAEALANTSAMTSPAANRRLAARKIELSLNTPDFVYDVENAEYIPPRDLLMYLLRMGSFNSAPKINNIDSQDDDVAVPDGLETRMDLVNHCKLMRGDNRPDLLQRSFFKSINDLSSNDVTDGLRYLNLNSVSKVCSSPKSSPNHIRILQWNILSQSLGQHNDNFVCCPADALTWKSRKYLIVQEIIQNDPDVICLQEVDHFKFLQTMLATVNYEGIFFPKPDSPCLYITENNGPDGCAIFFKKNKFDLMNYDTRVLEVWRIQSNQVTIAANLRVIETGNEICICTTHLKARNGALLAKLRNEQGKDLIRFVQRVADDRPILISGDFNAEPSEPVYSTVINNGLLSLSSAYADLMATLSNGNDDKNPDHTDNLDDKNDIGSEKCVKSRIDYLINNEPPFTTWKIREEGEVCHTIDYVFYSQDKLKVTNCLKFPQDNEIGKDRTPSHTYPSDHFSLICDFEILNSDKIIEAEI